jgi:hypothetical protein
VGTRHLAECALRKEALVNAMEDQVVHDRWGQLGFKRLLPEEQDYIMIWWLFAEVLNGSFAVLVRRITFLTG